MSLWSQQWLSGWCICCGRSGPSTHLYVKESSALHWGHAFGRPPGDLLLEAAISLLHVYLCCRIPSKISESKTAK